jgi:hypothetical protein
MEKKVLYNFFIINNLHIDIDCINLVKQKLFDISIDLALPPPMEITKDVGIFNKFTYNNVSYRYIECDILYAIYYEGYHGKWYKKGYTYYNLGWISYYAIIGYYIIEDGPGDTFICYKQ